MLKRRAPIAIIILLLVFSILHLGFSPMEIERQVVGTSMLGGWAFLLMTCSLFLSTRPRFVEIFFGGLDRMYQVHKMCGVFALLFILPHFFLIPKELPEGVDPVVMALVPSAPMGMLSMILLILSLVIALNRKIPYHRWRNPHKFMGLVYLLAVGHFMTAPAVFFERFSLSGIMLIFAAVIGTVSLLYSLFGMNRKTARRYVIDKVNALERATELVLKPLEQVVDFRPGQFAFIEVQGKGWKEPHPFTISSAPSEDNLRFTLKVLGDWTRKVREELQVGGEVLVRGPYGRFDAAKAGPKQIWLAGGIGLTPELAREEVQTAFEMIVPSAQVQLAMTEGRNNSVDLVSGVLQPGTYPMPNRNFTVMGLISAGGGISANLNNPQIRLMRGGQIYGTSVDKLLNNPRLDTLLKGGDRVFLEEDERYFLSFGAAGEEDLHIFSKDEMSAMDAVSIMGGLQDNKADPKGLLILREYPASATRAGVRGPQQARVVFSLDLTSADGLFSARRFQVNPNDLIMATESPVNDAVTVSNIFGNFFGVFNATGAI